MNTNVSLTLSRHFPRLKPRSNYGDLVMKPKAWDALMNWNLPATNCKLELLKLKKPSIPFNKRLQMLKNLRAECNPTWKKFPWNTNEPMLLLSSPKSVDVTSTRLLENGNPRLMTSLLKLKQAKRNAETITANSSDLRLLMMKPWNNWM